MIDFKFNIYKIDQYILVLFVFVLSDGCCVRTVKCFYYEKSNNCRSCDTNAGLPPYQRISRHQSEMFQVSNGK